MNEVPGRPASGVRIAGDDYQHLVTWNEVLLGLRPDRDVTHITVEAPDVGNLDDIVVEHGAETTYTQVKHAVDAQTTIGQAYLLDAATRQTAASLLGRFRDTWRELREHGAVNMQLVTDRELDPNDPLLRLLDRRTECLVPAILVTGLPAYVREARGQLGATLEMDDDELLAMLASLRLRTGRPYNAEAERAQTLMWGHGLRTGPQPLAVGVALIREWVQERIRRRDVERLRNLVAERCDMAENSGAVLVIEAIGDDPHPEDATERVRFVELYGGEDADSRRELREPGDWQEVVAPHLHAAAQRLRLAGHRRVVVRGAMRLPVWFTAGAALRHVHGFDVAGIQHGGLWSSTDATAPFPAIQTAETNVGAGADLAVAIGIATDPTNAVERYIREAELPADRLVTLTPTEGVGPQVVPDSHTAAGLSVAARQAMLHLLDEQAADRIHLFLAAPGAFGLLLGHRWNALRPTTVYEHLGAGRGYTPTLTIQS